MRIAAKLLFAALMTVVCVWSYLVPDAPMFQRPELARIFFWHFPCPMLLTVLLFTGCYFSLRYHLRIGRAGMAPETDPEARARWDVRALSAIELGFVFGLLTMASGIIFSLAQWGALWQWDKRQTSFLIALLIYGAYFAVRSAFSDAERRAAHSAAYMLAAALPLTFLIFVYPRLPQVERDSFHPTDTIMGGQLKGAYAAVTICVLILVAIVSVWLYRTRVAAGMLALENYYGEMEASGGSSAGTAVVGPVRLPSQS